MAGAAPDPATRFVAAHDRALAIRYPHAHGQQLEDGGEGAFAGVRLLLQPLALADVAHESLPLPVGQDVGVDLHRHPVAGLVAQQPFLDMRAALEHRAPGGIQPDRVALGDEVEDRLAQDFMRLHAEHAAARLVDVDVAAVHVRDEHAVGRGFEEGMGVGLAQRGTVWHRFGREGWAATPIFLPGQPVRLSHVKRGAAICCWACAFPSPRAAT